MNGNPIGRLSDEIGVTAYGIGGMLGGLIAMFEREARCIARAWVASRGRRVDGEG